jgi:hypothetical protein
LKPTKKKITGGRISYKLVQQPGTHPADTRGRDRLRCGC